MNKTIMKKLILYLFFITNIYQSVYAQCIQDPYINQETWWLPTGTQAVMIDFSSGSAVLNNPATGSFGQGGTGLGFEGNTTVTHPVTKKVLFVTDGNVAYNSGGVKATGSPVGGHASAEEAAAVIPDPQGLLGRDFIIFGNNTFNTPGSLMASKYNLSTNTIYGNTTLISGASIYEGLEVIPHSNGTDYWILVNTSDQKVKSYLYSKTTGFNSVAVSSTNVANLAGAGAATIAVNSFISWDPRQPGTLLIARQNKVGLASFDTSTGALGSWNVKVTVSIAGNGADINAQTGYSAVLSPNGRYLYYKEYSSSTFTSTIKYIDLNTNTTVSLGTIPSNSFGMKIAPDGKLYISGNSFKLYVVTNTPDSPSTVNSTAVLTQFNTGGRDISLQLPNNVYWQCATATCQATVAPVLASTNITPVPATIGNLIAQLSVSNQPSGTEITIHSGFPATDANKLATSTAVVSGTTYYVAFYDGLINCYSPVTAITVGNSSADLSVTKDDGKTAYIPGTTNIYTIVVRNVSGSNVLGAKVSDGLPAGIPAANMSYSTPVLTGGATTSITGPQTGALNDVVNLPVGATVTYAVTITIPVTYTGNLTNVATVTSPAGSSDPTLGNNTATDTDNYNCGGNDSDGDGIGDICDQDDDNDGIPDCIENGFDGNPNTVFKSNGNTVASSNSIPANGPQYQFRLTNTTNQQGQAWSYGKIDFSNSFILSMKAKFSDADGIALVFQNDPAGTNAIGTSGQGLGARGITNGIALELDTFTNSCTNDAANGQNCDPSYDHGSIRTTAGWIGAGKLAGDGQLGDGTIDDGLWHDVVVYWNASIRRLSYTFDGVEVTSYIFPTVGANSIETILGGSSKATFGYTGSTGSNGNTNIIGFDNPCTIPIFFDTDGDGINDHLDLDSDNDGCLDAIEGGASFTTANLVNAGGTVTVGTGSPASNQNLGNTVSNTASTMGIPTIAGTGQSIGDSQNAAIHSQCIAYCTKPGDFSIAGIPTKVGITNQTKLTGWPQSVPNGHITLESKENGFVITRVAKSADIADPKEGMMVYDIAAQCVKLYNGTVWKCIQRSCNN